MTAIKLSAAALKAECERIWNEPLKPDFDGMSHIARWDIDCDGCGLVRSSGRRVSYTGKAQRARERELAMYNPKLVSVRQAEAAETRVEIGKGAPVYHGRNMPITDGDLRHFVFKNNAKAPSKRQAPAKAAEKPAKAPNAKKAAGAKRVTKKRLEAAVAILAKIERSQLPAFFARFGIELKLAEQIAANDNLPEIAREFLKAAFAA